jgi:hypothetical protein
VAVAARLWKLLPDGSTAHGEDVPARARFMALSGLILSAFFALVILAMWLPVWILGPCVH